MPVYEYKCKEHGKFELFYWSSSVAEGLCPVCGVSGDRVFSTNNFKQFTPYYHIGFGETVNSPGQLKKLLKKHKVDEIGTTDLRSSRHKGMSERDMREAYRKGK